MASNLTLTRLSGFDRNKKAAFTADRVALGTDSASDLRFDPTWDKTVAARHVTLEWRGSELWAVDASKDGTFVSGKKISAEKLSPGAVLELGKGGPKVQVDFTAEVKAAPAPAAPPTCLAWWRR
ncbi:MAG: FHA domain-containing protein [bacterium]|nr:FHA domain-containing protein [bacterium]